VYLIAQAGGGAYVATALIWLWIVEGVRPTTWDGLGAAVTLLGIAIMMFAPRGA
jgi:small multidrug resistance family-3 protein